MRILVAPNAFAGTLSAAAAATAMAEGWRRERPDDEVTLLPMADGGDGTLEVVDATLPSTRRFSVEVADARGHATTADWLALPDGTALIESAQACGLHRLAPDLRNPRLTTTYGVGQLIAAALATGATRIIVGVGGTATVDGGAGMATALGHRLLREDTNGVKVGGEYVRLLTRIEAIPLPPVPMVAAVDVDAVLLGDDGAVAGFARQKGAGDGDLQVLEESLSTLAEVAERDLPRGPWRDHPGAGAGGGLGFGLAAFAGAELRPGAAMVADLVGLDEAIASSDVVITGEGRLDDWSVRGKATGYVAAVAARHGVTALAIVGSAVGAAEAEFDTIKLLGPAGLEDPAAAVAQAAVWLAKQMRYEG